MAGCSRWRGKEVADLTGTELVLCAVRVTHPRRMVLAKPFGDSARLTPAVGVGRVVGGCCGAMGSVFTDIGGGLRGPIASRKPISATRSDGDCEAGRLMRIANMHKWPTSEAEAIAIQDDLRGLVNTTGSTPTSIRAVAGIDAAYDDHGNVAAAVVVLDAANLEIVDSAVAYGQVEFPYVPGLLAFRELPSVVAALERLTVIPDLFVCDGQGLAHPRRFGLACHVGVLTDVSTIGVAKTPLGSYEEPADDRGAWSELLLDGEVVGRALRTQRRIKPVYVSVGHGIDLGTACQQILDLSPRYRQPETTRQADQLCRRALKEHTARRSAAHSLMLSEDNGLHRGES